MYNESTFEAAGINVQVVSRHYDLIIEDDTVAPDASDMTEEFVVPTKEQITQAIGWHKLSDPLFDNPTSGQHLVVGTRWFEKDLISWVQESEEYKSYTRSCLENEKGEPDELGEPTFPERFPREYLAGLKRSKGIYFFSCLYMNKPLSSEMMTFKPEWIQYYETPPVNIVTWMTVDPAGNPEEIRNKKKSDYNVVLVCGKDLISGRVYVLDFVKKRCTPGELIDDIMTLAMRWRPLRIGVETVAYQGTLCYWLRERMTAMGQWYMVEPVADSTRAKAARVMGLVPVFQNRAILLRPWMQDLVQQLMSYPLGSHDDIIDALAYQLPMWRTTRAAEAKQEDETPDKWGIAELIKKAKADPRSRFKPPMDLAYVSDEENGGWLN